MCEDFLETITESSRHIAITALRSFADYGALLTHDSYAEGFRPWGKTSAVQASGQRNVGEIANKTPVIPDEVFAPLLAACLFLVDDVGPEIVAALEAREALSSIPHAHPGNATIDFDRRLDSYLANARHDQRALPSASRSYGRSHYLDLPMIALHLGLRETKALLRHDRWHKLTAAADELGLAPGGFHGPDSRMSFNTATIRSTSRVVLTACYIVVAALSGLRSSELAAIERGSYRRETMDGGVIRYRLHSTLLKGEPPGGRREVWTVIAPVVAALELSEKLSESSNPINLQQFSVRFPELRKWVNGTGSDHGLTPIPEEWEVIPRQFRRTLARELAWRPNGVIAGKIHLKHVSVATTEGYAGQRGESANAFLAEIEAEYRRKALHDTQNVIESLQRGEPVAGLGAKELASFVSTFHDLTEGPQVRNRDDVIVELVRSRAEILHITPFCFCWFRNPKLARCLRGVADKSHPIVGSCQPDKCVQATIHQEHVPVWLSGIDALRATIKEPRLPKGEQVRLSGQIEEMEAVVEPLRKGNE
ncbi:hypothetical protein ACLRGF_05670 [Mycetocola zhadangensis]|uniref:hypothetical protein n=1 Tax=Mycetocola zhadangensis TaxID=1164595 RepID=UPI003A4E0B8D